MLRKKSILMICMTMLVVLALVLAGCGGGGGGNNNPGGDNGGDNGGGNNNPADPSKVIGTWKSQGVTPPVEIKIDSRIGTSYFYTGKVTCENFNLGYLNITESDNNILIDKYIIVQEVEIEGTKISSIHVRTREEYDDGELANELSLDGFFDGDVLKVVWLEISRQESGLFYEFDSEGEDYLTFEKQ